MINFLLWYACGLVFSIASYYLMRYTMQERRPVTVATALGIAGMSLFGPIAIGVLLCVTILCIVTIFSDSYHPLYRFIHMPLSELFKKKEQPKKRTLFQ